MYTKRTYGGPVTRAAKRYKTKVSQSDHAKLLRLQRTVAALKPETKYLQLQSQNNNVTSAGVVAYLSGIAQGVTDATRVGDSIRAQWLDVSIHTEQMTTPGYIFRVDIVKDKMNDQGFPTVSQIFTSADPTANFVNRLFDQRFKILQTYWFSSNAWLSGGQEAAVVKNGRLSLGNMPIEFTGTGATIASAGKNALFIVITTNDGSSTMDIAVNCELAFTDV